MNTPVYTCFYTRGTLYELEAARLRKSLDRLGLDHDMVAVDSKGDWVANTRQTATFIYDQLCKYHGCPMVYLDADAFVWSRPILFENLTEDVAVHYRQGRELLNGTAFFNCTPGARLVAAQYRELITNNPGCVNEQTMLAKAIDDIGEAATIHRLPASYCWIHDIMRNDLNGEEPVIEHLQASRETHVSEHTLARRKRIATIMETCK